VDDSDRVSVLLGLLDVLKVVICSDGSALLVDWLRVVGVEETELIVVELVKPVRDVGAAEVENLVSKVPLSCNVPFVVVLDGVMAGPVELRPAVVADTEVELDMVTDWA
jgi:hypothetical protein